MKKMTKSCLLLAIVSFVLLSGCAHDNGPGPDIIKSPSAPVSRPTDDELTTTFDLQLNGKHRNEVMGHKHKMAISGGKPSGGTYSGPGVVENGFFIPGKAGDGRHEITYSKPGYRSSVAQITVFGTPMRPKPCPECKGKKVISCSECKGNGKQGNNICKKCKGKGTIPCPGCVNVPTIVVTPEIVHKILEVFSTCRLKLEGTLWGRDELILEMSHIDFDEQSILNPVMMFYNDLPKNGKRDESLKLKSSEHDFHRRDSSVPVSFTFLIRLSELEKNEIHFIKVKVKYVNYELELYYDLRDIMEKDGKLQRTVLYPKVIHLIKEPKRFYRLPYGLAALDVKNNQEKESDPNWRDVETYKNWHYQENSKKMYVRIVNDSNSVVFYSKNPKMRKKDDGVWKLVKDWLSHGKSDHYWETIANKPYASLEAALK